MSRGKQAGSPVWFRCYRERQGQDRWRNMALRRHTVRLTGRARPYRPQRGSALGQRSTTTAREYVCACGHVGWSNHVDLETMEQA